MVAPHLVSTQKGCNVVTYRNVPIKEISAPLGQSPPGQYSVQTPPIHCPSSLICFFPVFFPAILVNLVLIVQDSPAFQLSILPWLGNNNTIQIPILMALSASAFVGNPFYHQFAPSISLNRFLSSLHFKPSEKGLSIKFPKLVPRSKSFWHYKGLRFRN